MDRGDVLSRPARLAIFARAPVPGRAKTRLIPALGPEGAARLHGWLVQRTVEMAAGSACHAVTLWCTPDAEHSLFQCLQARHGVALRVQHEGDLGARMHAALQVESKHGPAILIGTDCPGLTAGIVAQAARALGDGDDAVFVPALDGGYALIGVSRSDERLFDDVPWGTGEVMAETRARLRTMGWRWRELEPLWDVDRPEDLERLAGVSALHGAQAARLERG